MYNKNVIKLNVEFDNFGDFSPDQKLKKKLLKNGYKNTKKICINNLNLFSTKIVNNIIDDVISELTNS